MTKTEMERKESVLAAFSKFCSSLGISGRDTEHRPRGYALLALLTRWFPTLTHFCSRLEGKFLAPLNGSHLARPGRW
jgi:hypothetical protein